MACTCTPGSMCRGLGTMRVDEPSQPSGWDLETCDECSGSGIVEECDYCHDAREADEEQL